MASAPQKDSTFGILGSSKLNTADGKNPQPNDCSAAKPALDIANEGRPESSNEEQYRRECQRAHDEMEARLKDEELHGRSRGWSG